MIILKRLEIEDLDNYEFWKHPKHSYHLLNGPYFKKATKTEIEKEMQTLKIKLQNDKNILENLRIITNENNEMIGEVSWYWKSKETNWLEVGIVIFNEKFWIIGIGYTALKLWINEVFRIKDSIVRIGITTWSGNVGMIKLAKKLGMKEEARYKKARIVNEEYFDSVSYGILREEWENNEL
ncbi:MULTISPECIES: GNAT family N-acetyltransferase [Aquimarina]|uniref:GNAT family N-acetyltransferase n=1 Tax=Aquimarina TaxID=290174 RepID=UPI0009423F3A|nr:MULTISPECIES: GNAT family protein [Aquimarina]